MRCRIFQGKSIGGIGLEPMDQCPASQGSSEIRTLGLHGYDGVRGDAQKPPTFGVRFGEMGRFHLFEPFTEVFCRQNTRSLDTQTMYILYKLGPRLSLHFRAPELRRPRARVFYPQRQQIDLIVLPCPLFKGIFSAMVIGAQRPYVAPVVD